MASASYLKVQRASGFIQQVGSCRELRMVFGTLGVFRSVEALDKKEQDSEYYEDLSHTDMITLQDFSAVGNV